MHAVIGRVTIKPGHEDETLAMIDHHGVGMLQGMAGSEGAIGRGRSSTVISSNTPSGCSRERRTRWPLRRPSTRSATCRTAPASFLSVDVCEVIGQV